jgi:hypothetical protein
VKIPGFRRFFLDCEWNDYRGTLISMALVPEVEGDSIWYAVFGCLAPTPWVKRNVLPVLGVEPDGYVMHQVARVELADYLGYDDGPPSLIVADWPEDIERFCDFLIIGPGQRIKVPELAFWIAREAGDAAQSQVPHNAVEDALALRAAVLNQERGAAANT